LAFTTFQTFFNPRPSLLELLCILVFGSIIFVWGVRYHNIKDEFKHFNLPKWLRDLVGIFKFSFAIMLLNDDLTVVCLGAMGIAVLMIAALITHIRLKSEFTVCFPPFLCSVPALRLPTWQIN
jgi:hypothetical protein